MRPDIITRVELLTTRFQETDKDDEKKLSRVLKYLQSTRNLVLTLYLDGSGTIKWWVDTSFAVHHDMRSHTRGSMSILKGAVYSASSKQKLNTNTSTEAELVGVNDLNFQILWMRFFWRIRASKCHIILFIKIIKAL